MEDQHDSQNHLRIFLSYSIGDENRNIVDAFEETAGQQGFEVIKGTSPAAKGPDAHVRQKILSCDCFAALMTPHGRGAKASAWVYNEIGMAYVLGLPLVICKESGVKDAGLAQFDAAYQTFDRGNLKDFKRQLASYLESVKNDPRLTGANSLGGFINTLAREAIHGHDRSENETADAIDRLARITISVVSEASKLRFSFGESDPFAKRRDKNLPQKRAIAAHIFENHLQSRAQHPEVLAFLDSGTVTYTICEEIVSRACRIPVLTNNIASCRVFSTIPAYPAFVVPGEFDSHYVAALGSECTEYLEERLAQSDPPNVDLSLIAATSLNSHTGICGNDQRHNDLKRLLMERCPKSIVVFEGEKLLGTVGSPIFTSHQQWKAFADSCRQAHRDILFVTHVPDDFHSATNTVRRLFNTEVQQLRNLFGEEAIVVLGDYSAD